MHAAELNNRAAGHCEVRNPNVVVAVHNHCPRAGKSAASEGRAGKLRAIRTQQRNTTTISVCLPRHKSSEGLVSIPSGFENQDVVDGLEECLRRTTKAVGHPSVSLTVNRHTAAAVTGAKFFDLGWVGCREASYMSAKGVGNPDAILLVNGEMERSKE